MQRNDVLKKGHGGNIRAFIKQYNLPKNKLVDFSANINPLGLPNRIKKLIRENINSLRHYPQPDSCGVRHALANFHHINPQNVLAGNGSIELIYLIPQALKIKKALIITPTFSEYESACKLYGVKTLFLNTNEDSDFKIDMVKLEKLIPKVNLIFLCNPNNPTGVVVSGEDMRFLMHMCAKHKVFLVVDEAFMDFVENGNQFTILKEAVKNNYVLVLRSLTKIFALAGLRLGYLVGHLNLINKLSSFQYPWNVNTLAQICAEEVVKDKAYINKTREFISKEKSYLFTRLKEIAGLKVYPPSVNFILCKLEDSALRNVDILSRKLARSGIIIRNCSNFRGLNNRFFRIAVRKRRENRKLIKALKVTLE